MWKVLSRVYGIEYTPTHSNLTMTRTQEICLGAVILCKWVVFHLYLREKYTNISIYQGVFKYLNYWYFGTGCSVSVNGRWGFLPWKIGKYYKSGIFVFSRAGLQAQYRTKRPMFKERITIKYDTMPDVELQCSICKDI